MGLWLWDPSFSQWITAHVMCQIHERIQESENSLSISRFFTWEFSFVFFYAIFEFCEIYHDYLPRCDDMKFNLNRNSFDLTWDCVMQFLYNLIFVFEMSFMKHFFMTQREMVQERSLVEATGNFLLSMTNKRGKKIPLKINHWRSAEKAGIKIHKFNDTFKNLPHTQ